MFDCDYIDVKRVCRNFTGSIFFDMQFHLVFFFNLKKCVSAGWVKWVVVLALAGSVGANSASAKATNDATHSNAVTAGASATSESTHSSVDECQVTPVIHVLQYPGCVPKPIPSFACTGRCSSYLQVRHLKSSHNLLNTTCR